jgi:hypothetical protein
VTPGGYVEEAEAFGGGGDDEGPDETVVKENSVSGPDAFNYTEMPFGSKTEFKEWLKTYCQVQTTTTMKTVVVVMVMCDDDGDDWIKMMRQGVKSEMTMRNGLLSNHNKLPPPVWNSFSFAHKHTSPPPSSSITIIIIITPRLLIIIINYSSSSQLSSVGAPGHEGQRQAAGGREGVHGRRKGLRRLPPQEVSLVPPSAPQVAPESESLLRERFRVVVRSMTKIS